MHWAKNPFLFGHSAFIWPKPDMELMNSVLQGIIGSHDFRPFGKQMPYETHYRCRVQKAEWALSPAGDELILTIDANRFLRAMVRALVQACIEIGQGKQPADYIQSRLAAQLDQIPNALAPPEGLYLYKVEYPNLYEGLEIAGDEG
jgi:tRNA pseudouridine38-40 synthase